MRLDSLTPGGKATVEALKTEIHALLAREKKLDLIMPKAQQIAMASKGSTLEAAAIPAGFATIVSPSFARTSQVVGLGVGNAAIGAAFGLPLKQVGEPVKATTTVIIERVDVRTLADSAAFEKNKVQQRLQAQQRIREQAVQQYVQNLRENASITDKRKDIQRRSASPRADRTHGCRTPPGGLGRRGAFCIRYSQRRYTRRFGSERASSAARELVV